MKKVLFILSAVLFASHVSAQGVCDSLRKREVTNVVTPNNDGSNDVWVIGNLPCYGDNELIIYNRWGGEVYRILNYNNNWGGGNLSSGVYYYCLTLRRTGQCLSGTLHVLHE